MKKITRIELVPEVGDRVLVNHSNIRKSERGLGTIVYLPYEYGRYTIKLDSGKTTYVLDHEFKLMEE